MATKRILNHFGVPERTTYVSDLFRMYVKDLVNAIRDNHLIAIIGQFGAGKSHLFRHAVKSISRDSDKTPVFIHVRSKDKERIRIGHIMSAICFDLNESPRRDQEARARQVIRLLGEKHVVQKKQVCIVIENAHGLHANTLMAIKDLREDEFAGHSPLFSVVLVGQEPLKNKLSLRREVLYRSNLLELNDSNGWMNFDDRIRYVKHVYGDAITATAIKRIAHLWKVPLELDYNIERKLEDAFKAGFEQITEQAFQITPQEMLDSLNAGLSTKDANYISFSKIADKAAIGKTTVSDVLSGHNTKKASAVSVALEKLAEDRTDKVRKVA